MMAIKQKLEEIKFTISTDIKSLKMSDIVWLCHVVESFLISTEIKEEEKEINSFASTEF